MQEQYGQQNQSFEFTGKGWEYFKIWIVNLLLTIVTFGIYKRMGKSQALAVFLPQYAFVRRKLRLSRHTQSDSEGASYRACIADCV